MKPDKPQSFDAVEPILFLLGTEQDDDAYSIRSDPEPGHARATTPTPGTLVPLALGHGDRSSGPLLAEVKSFQPTAGGDGELTLRVLAPSAGREVAAILEEVLDPGSGPVRGGRTAVQERIRGERRLGQLADALVRYGLVGQLRSSRRAPIEVRAIGHADGAIRWRLPANATPPDPPFLVEITGYNSIFHVEVARCTVEGDALVTPLPEEVVRLRRRWRRRVEASAGYAIRFRHPHWPERELVREVNNLSDGGLSFRTEPRNDIVYPGLVLRDVEVTAPDAAPARMDAEVRFVTEDLCGLRLFHATAEDEQRWLQVVTRALHPRTRADDGWSEATWRLYERAGYFNLSGKDGRAFSDLKPAFLACERKIAAAPHLGCRVVWPVDGGDVFAALSVLRVYHGTWLGYQMAKVHGDAPDGRESRQVLRDIHLHAYEHAQLDPDLRWLLGWAQVKPVWSRLVHHELPERYLAAGLSSVLRFRALEVPCDAAIEVTAQGVRVGEATPIEIELLLRRLARDRPRAYLESHDLTVERLDLAALRRRWREAGLARERAVLVARRAGQPLAAAVLEAAEPGLHLFRLLDQVRLYPIVPGGGGAFDALLAEARGWFRALGRDRFVLFLEQGVTLPAPSLAALTDMGEADMTILSAELLPELLEHLVEVTAPRPRR